MSEKEEEDEFDISGLVPLYQSWPIFPERDEKEEIDGVEEGETIERKRSIDDIE